MITVTNGNFPKSNKYFFIQRQNSLIFSKFLSFFKLHFIQLHREYSRVVYTQKRIVAKICFSYNGRLVSTPVA